MKVNYTYQRKQNNRVADVLICRVRAFYSRDDVSRITTGKRQTLTQKKNKKQKWFLLDTIKNIHTKFLAEEQSSISYSLFCKLRPFWVVHPTLSDRDTCMCKMHENLGFLVQKLHYLKVISTLNLDDLVKEISCQTENIKCMYGECSECKDLSCPVSTEYNPENNVCYIQWVVVDKQHKNDPNGKTSKITIKKEFQTTQEELLEWLNLLLHRFKRHTFNINNQFTHYRALRQNLKVHECLIHVDFSENYLCKYSTEIQAVHFGASHQQATLHTGVSEMPNDVPPVPSIMRIHQVVSLAHGELIYRDVSCLCTTTQNLNCGCLNAKHFKFSNQQTAPMAPTETEVQWQSLEVVGIWCVLKYDGDLFPDVITDTSEIHVEVRCMQKIGVNRFFWPAREDILWYLFEDIVCIIPPPRAVTGRHMEIESEVWAKLNTF